MPWEFEIEYGGYPHHHHHHHGYYETYVPFVQPPTVIVENIQPGYPGYQQPPVIINNPPVYPGAPVYAPAGPIYPNGAVYPIGPGAVYPGGPGYPPPAYTPYNAGYRPF